MNQAEVLVVGAGPVGLTLAAELARRGVVSRIIDQSVGPSTTSKAIAIQPRTLEIFRHMGIVDEVLARGFLVGAGNFYCNGRLLARIDFHELDSPYGFMVDLPQNETEQVLLEHLARNGLRVEHETRLLQLKQDSGGVEVEVARPSGGETIRAQYVVGCDGAHSTVRHALGLEYATSPAPELVALADAQVDWLYPSELHIFMHSDGFLACFPLPGGRFRLIADITAQEPEDAAQSRPPRATPERLRSIIRRRADPDANISEITWLAAFAIQRQAVKCYSRGRAFLAGDAAHVPSPAGGQGMNTGIQDACNLAWKMQLVLRGDATETLLESYNAERAPVGRDVVALSDAFAQAATSGLASMVHQISEIGINYRQSPIVAQDWNRPGGPQPGDRAPVIGDLNGTSHHLLLFSAGDRDLSRLAELQRAAPEGIVATRLVTPSPVEWNAPLLLDENLSIHKQYGATSNCAYLIRPDGYVAYRCSPADPERLCSYLRSVLRL